MNFAETLKALEPGALLECVEAAGVRETGLPGGMLADRLREAAGMTAVAAALNNADTDFVLLSLLDTEPESVFQGIALAARFLGTEEKVLYLPEERPEAAAPLASLAQEYGVTLRTEFVNVRENENTLLLHIGTAADLAHAVRGDYVSGVYLSVNGGPLSKVPDGTPIADLADLTGAKGLLMGYELRPAKDGSLTVEQAPLENGVLRVLSEKDCAVAVTARHLLASRARSCGKCVFCREGLIQLEYEHREMTVGRGRPEFTDMTHEIGSAMGFSTCCTMGQNAARIALSAQDNFPEEFTAHIRRKHCPSGSCIKLVNIYINPRKCTGCGECLPVCPYGCIDGRPGYIHTVDDFDCTKCGKCAEVCPADAIVITTGRAPRTPMRPIKVGRFRD